MGLFRFYFFIIIVVVLVFFLLSGFWKAYKKCPPGHVLIIFNNKPDVFGNMFKVYYSGGAFVWPLVGSYELLSLAPLTIKSKLERALSADNQRVDIESTFTIGISTNEGVLSNAVERIVGLKETQIKEIARDIIEGNLRIVISELQSDNLVLSAKLIDVVTENTEPELNKLGLKIINLDIKGIERKKEKGKR